MIAVRYNETENSSLLILKRIVLKQRRKPVWRKLQLLKVKNLK